MLVAVENSATYVTDRNGDEVPSKKENRGSIDCPVGLYLFALVLLISEGWIARKEDLMQVVMEHVAVEHFSRGMSLVVRTWRYTNFRKVCLAHKVEPLRCQWTGMPPVEP